MVITDYLTAERLKYFPLIRHKVYNKILRRRNIDSYLVKQSYSCQSGAQPPDHPLSVLSVAIVIETVRCGGNLEDTNRLLSQAWHSLIILVCDRIQTPKACNDLISCRECCVPHFIVTSSVNKDVPQQKVARSVLVTKFMILFSSHGQLQKYIHFFYICTKEQIEELVKR